MTGRATAPSATATEVIFLLAAISSSLQTLASASPVRDRTSSAPPSVIIINGTSADIGFMDNAFIYCRIQQLDTQDFLHHYTIEWHNSLGNAVPTWRQDAHVFTIGRGSHMAHSYLVFQDFTNRLSGDYSCSVKRNGTVLSSSRIAVR